MNSSATLRKAFAASPLLAAVAYAGIVFVLLIMVIISIAGVLDQRAEVASSTAMLEQLEGRRPAVARGQSA
jgi:general secretion pathway protein M